eukprot:scpid48242/ scgid1664/ Peroxisomal acyl-coenzyme A oxidase 1; Palmitoyl-CoA oxidase
MDEVGKAPSHQSHLLAQERKRRSFDLEELTIFLNGGADSYKSKKEMEAIVLKDPILRQDDLHFLSHEEEYRFSLQRSKRAIELLRELKLEWGSAKANKFWQAAESESFPVGLNLHMFTHALASQGTKEQVDFWVPLAKDFRIIGCYAQTELGHGSFLRGLETRAEYDQTTQEFILNTPTLTSMKWWPGSLGKTATHALVIARLYMAGRERGIHMFIMQLRDMETHQPLPGITVGNIGPRVGYNPNDNGFLGLKNVRIPRMHMLMRFAEVTPDGRYASLTRAAKPSYGTMVWIRAGLVTSRAVKLSKAVTIAIRYSAVRQQGHIDDKAGEVAVLDYVSQQHLLFPLLAASLAYLHVGRWLYAEYERYRPDNAMQAAEMHANSSTLKALSAYVATKGIETCRRACGGHGYSRFSGLPHIYKYATAAETYEGEAMVLHLQTGRFLMKALRLFKSGQTLTGTIKYLSHWLTVASDTSPIVPAGKSLADLFVLSNVFECAAARLIALAGQKLEHFLKQDGLSKEQAMNRAAPWLVRASEAHGEALFLVRFASIGDAKLSRPAKEMLKNCALLYGLWRIEENTMFFMETGTLTPGNVQSAREHISELLALLRPDVVSLVDAFDHPDEVLHSALGAYDGDVYKRMYDYAKREPLNKTEVADGIHEYLKPLMKSKV